MERIAKLKAIQTEYLGILAFLTGGIAFVPWYLWMARASRSLGKPSLAIGAGGLGIALLVYLLSWQVLQYQLEEPMSRSAETAFALCGYVILAAYFTWNEAFRRAWNSIQPVGDRTATAMVLWTFSLGPLYLNFKINQARGTEL